MRKSCEPEVKVLSESCSRSCKTRVCSVSEHDLKKQAVTFGHSVEVRRGGGDIRGGGHKMLI
jgi:hypothetical protein